MKPTLAFRIHEIYFSACKKYPDLGKDFKTDEVFPSLAIQFKSPH